MRGRLSLVATTNKQGITFTFHVRTECYASHSLLTTLGELKALAQLRFLFLTSPCAPRSQLKLLTVIGHVLLVSDSARSCSA
jgi:hypothetical protein